MNQFYLSSFIIFILHILTHNLKILGEWENGIYRLTVSLIVRKLRIYIELVSPLLTDNGHRLYHSEVHIVEGEDGKDFGEAAAGVGECED